jgi:signal transduction histidine kinase
MPNLSDEQRSEAVDEIENDIDRLQRVANRFSDIGSMPKLEQQRLAPIVEQTATYIRRRIPQRREQITLTAEVPDDLKAPVNEELFAWVVENLLKNALDAIDGAGRIALTAGTDATGVWIEVEDTGAGIERSQWKNIFRPGYSTKKRGWGLGLSLARRVIEDYHGGSLRLVDSTVGEGSTFRIDLPTD